MTPEHDALAERIGSHRDALALQLEALDESRWSVASLCEGWTVCDVVAHLVRLHGYLRSPHRYVAGAMSHGLRPNHYQYEDARRYAAAREPAGLVRQLRSSRYEDTWVWRHHPWPEATLAELVVHGGDIRRPLGIAYDTPIADLVAVVDLIVKRAPRPLRYPLGGWRLPAVRFEANDADWAWGSGPVVTGPLESIVMVLARRSRAAADLKWGTALLR